MAFMQRKASSLYLPVQRDAFGGEKFASNGQGQGRCALNRASPRSRATLSLANRPPWKPTSGAKGKETSTADARQPDCRSCQACLPERSMRQESFRACPLRCAPLLVQLWFLTRRRHRRQPPWLPDCRPRRSGLWPHLRRYANRLRHRL